MNKKDFENLLTGIRALGATLRDELQPKITYQYTPETIKQLRTKLKLSQPDFARMIGVPAGTLRNWEQGVRRPKGPALALLRVAHKHPEAVVDALYGNVKQ